MADPSENQPSITRSQIRRTLWEWFGGPAELLQEELSDFARAIENGERSRQSITLEVAILLNFLTDDRASAETRFANAPDELRLAILDVYERQERQLNDFADEQGIVMQPKDLSDARRELERMDYAFRRRTS